MRKIITASIALTGMLGLAPLGASAAPAAVPVAPHAFVGATVQPADWDDCGPRCQAWRHRQWEHQQAERREQWRREHYRWNGQAYRQWNGYGYGDRD